MKTIVSLVRCGTYESSEVDKAVRRAVGYLGGITSFVKPGMRILLKPNLLSARTPDRHVTTHPEVVRALIRLVKEAGGIPLLGDSPGGAVKGVERVWVETGMKKLAQEENIELVNFETAGSVEKPIAHPLIKTVRISRVPLEADGVINIPKLKTHGLLIFTAGVKNIFGCVPGLRKGEYHKLAPYPDDFARLLSEIYLLVEDKILFSLVDGITGMEGNGPSSGELRQMNLLAASADTVALDSCLISLLGFKPGKIGTIKHLARGDAGPDGLANTEIAGDSPEVFDLAKFKFPSNWHINLVPKFLIRLLGKLIWMKPEINPAVCVNCLLCVNSCPVNTIKSAPGKKPFVEKSGCISCLCCHELCPYKAIDLKGSFLAKRMFRL